MRKTHTAVYDIEQNFLLVYNKVVEYEIKIYATEEGKEPFCDWLDNLKDADTQALVFRLLS